MTEHTTLPWKAWATDGTLWIGGDKGYTVEFEDGDDAMLAATAANYHHRLVEALHMCATQIDDERPTSRCMDNIVSDTAWKLITEIDGENK